MLDGKGTMMLIHQHPEWVFAAGCGLLIFSVVTVVLLRASHWEVTTSAGLKLLLCTIIGAIMVLYGGYEYLSH